MSNLVFPTNIPGITWNITRTSMFKTRIQESPSGKESRMNYQYYPRTKFNLQYELLRDNIAVSEFRALSGLFEAMQGQYDTFLYSDPDFNTVTAEPFGTGDGVTTAFQLTAKLQNSGGPGWPTLIQNFNGTPSIYKNGVLQTAGTNYTLGATGIVTFSAAPASSLPLTWSGSFYYRCRFTQDTLDFLKQAYKWWQLDAIEFISIKL